mgnify:CR=1 FL=1
MDGIFKIIAVSLISIPLNKQKNIILQKIEVYILKSDRSKKFVLWFNELGIEDVPLVGGKNASLGEMYRNLTGKGVKIPNGFAVTAYAYDYLLEKAKIKDEIKRVIGGLDTSNMKNLSERGRKVREIILKAEFPKELTAEIFTSYKKLCREYGPNTDVAVRSSATAEDLPDASFAGQQETYLNIRGERALIEACKKCFASLFTNRAISYRVDRHFDHFKVALSIGVQKMVRSDKACSGVMFSIDTESGFKDAVLINGAYGLGENVVLGAVNPDQFYVFKPTLKKGFKPILSKKLGSKKIKMIYSEHGIKHSTENVDVPYEARFKFVLNDGEILRLAKWACIIEDYYSAKAKKFKPMDMEWAKDGVTGELFIVQARPETVQSQRNFNILEEYFLKEKGQAIISGLSVGMKIGTGKARVIKDAKDIGSFKPGEILITEKTDPDWEPIMKIASAIVTNRGGRTAHAAIIARELGIPAIVGTENGTELVKTGTDVTVCCAEGEIGKVYKGRLKFDIRKIDLKKLSRPKTMIMMNVGNPDSAFEFSFIPNDGVGLAREEFIISSYIKVHPLALLHYDKLKDAKVKQVIDSLTYSYKSRVDFFIEKLAQGVAMIGAAFYPKPVIVRMSDFKSNEYANLIGGTEFEPHEENPMIGWRGASRYYTGNYREAFGLECMAMKKAREEMGLNNIKLMIPFCRTVDEGKSVVAEMKKYGLVQGKNGLEIYVMCEIPSNVVLADDFAKIFDGFSIGSNDLTQLTLGLDRDSELVSRLYDERNPAVKRMVWEVIHKCKRNGVKIGICGQAPSQWPEFAEFLVKCGIDSISLNPDTVIKTTVTIAEAEKKLRKK